jgi:hypothetical protein
MTMKISCHLICIALLLVSDLESAEVTAAPKLSMSNLSGVPTPLEEYGLSIGDITVTRVINPLGQLKNGSPVMLARRIQNITNPWAELTPGTAIVVDGQKAVIRQIKPDTAPKNRGENLKVTVTAEGIDTTKMSLQWQQELHDLNSPETRVARKQAITRVKKDLRVGSHLILENERVVITERTLSNPKNSIIDSDLKLFIKYQASSGPGELTGSPSTSEVVTDSAWIFRKNDGAQLANKTAQLITWKLKNRDGDDQRVPRVSVLHRSRGSIAQLQLHKQDQVKAVARFEQAGHSHTHIFTWNQKTDNKGLSLWRMKPGIDVYAEVFRVNDTNIDFKVTPEALLGANRKVANIQSNAALLTTLVKKGVITEAEADAMREEVNQNINTSPLTPGNVDSESLENQIKALNDIIKSDASKTIKLDAKRQAVIYLARYYEHSAVSHDALANEYYAREVIQLDRARILERHAWANSEKLKLIRNELIRRKEVLPAMDKPAPGRAEDTKIEQELITKLDKDLKAFKTQIQDESRDAISSPSLKKEHDDFLRKTTEQISAANKFRENAKNYRLKAEKLQTKIKQDFNYSLQFWTEYLHRTEGLAGDERLSESGVSGNIPPPDPYIPEILLRQAWIYRQMGRPELALSTYYSVLTAATQQKVDNLTRFGRIVLVARSQIANTYYEDANPLELKSYISAIDLYERLLNSKQEEINTNLIELKLLRSLFKADENSRLKLRKLKLKLTRLKQTPSPTTKDISRNVDGELNQIKSEIEKLDEIRQNYWRKMEKRALAFINRTAESETLISHHHTGEVRYYQIMAYNALGQYQHVWQSMEVLLENQSTPNEQREAWAAARVRVVIDIANRLFSNGKILMKNDPPRVVLYDDGKEIQKIPEWRRNLESALVYYNWALQNDPSYRSQILIRQQMGFCHHRLSSDNDLTLNEQSIHEEDARAHYAFILRLCGMHPNDVINNPTIRVIRDLTRIRLQNLNLEIKRKEKTRPQQNPPS